MVILLNIGMLRVEVSLCGWRIESKLVHVFAVCSNSARISEPPEETVSYVHWSPQPDRGTAGAPQARTETIIIIQKRLHVISLRVKPRRTKQCNGNCLSCNGNLIFCDYTSKVITRNRVCITRNGHEYTYSEMITRNHIALHVTAQIIFVSHKVSPMMLTLIWVVQSSEPHLVPTRIHLSGGRML